MKNEHGLECPFNWEDVILDHKWVAMHADNRLWSYRDKPYIHGDEWFSLSSIDFPMDELDEAPADFKQCLWQRPKTTHT